MLRCITAIRIRDLGAGSGAVLRPMPPDFIFFVKRMLLAGMKVPALLMLPALATALQLSTFTPVSNARAARATTGVWMQEVEASIEVSADAETSMDMAAAVPEKNERFKAISINALDEWAEKFPRLKVEAKDIKLASLIFPFKARSAHNSQLTCAPSPHRPATRAQCPCCTTRAISARLAPLCITAHRPLHLCTFPAPLLGVPGLAVPGRGVD
jgi:hypothetical protein